MPPTPLPALVAWLDTLLRPAELPDYPGALNGLQLENSGTVTHLAAAVDWSRAAVEATAAAGPGGLLLVHHGMFWGGAQPIVGAAYGRLRAAIGADVAVYGAHLPLDAHPALGNNALLARALGLEPTGSFLRYKTLDVGVQGEADVETATLAARATAFGAEHGHHTVHTPIAPGRRTRRWGICTGAGASSDSLREAVALGLDTLIVGEGPHHTAVEAVEQGLVVVYAGHYATETLGVRALAERAAAEFGLPWRAVGEATGL